MEQSIEKKKRSKTRLTLEDQCQKIDRTTCNVFEYANELFRLIAEENRQALPNLEQLQFVERLVHRFYWTSNPQQVWSDIIDKIDDMFIHTTTDNDFRRYYFKYLFDNNENNSNEIERLLQMT
jgi:hypothetical protein